MTSVKKVEIGTQQTNAEFTSCQTIYMTSLISGRGASVGFMIKLRITRTSTRSIYNSQLAGSPTRRNCLTRSISSHYFLSTSNALRPFTSPQAPDQLIVPVKHEKNITSHLLEHRPYQKDSLDACLDALSRGVNRIGVSLPTGSGKTVTLFPTHRQYS